MSDPVTGFIEASLRLAGIGDPSGPTAAEAAANDHVARVRSAIALPLPRTERRLRVPLEVAGQMLTGTGDGPRPYDRFLLPPAVQALSTAELADALSQAEARLAAAKAAAAEESETLAREAAEELKTAQVRAAAEVAAAKLALEMGRIKAEEELAMARSAFLAEKQELVKSLREAEERAEKAKKAAIAAIGNL